MTKGKNFSNPIASAVGTLTEGKIAEPAAPEKKDYVKIILRMDKDLHAALQQIALDKAAEMGRRYSLTELINDILKNYVQKNF